MRLGCRVLFVLVAGSFLAASLKADGPPERRPPIVNNGPEGMVTVNRSGSSWLSPALDELAQRQGKIVVRCGFERVVDHWSEVRDTRPLQVAPTVEGMRTLLQLSESELSVLSDTVVLVQAIGDDCDRSPLLITATEVRGMGPGLALGVSTRELALRLLQTSQHRQVGPPGLFGPVWIASYFWASREGSGREIYIIEQSSRDLSALSPPSRTLRKAVVGENGGSLSVRDLWQRDTGDLLPVGCEGPVAQLEQDFNGDGVVDIVCFSAMTGRGEPRSPLVVFSGATGRRMGELGGYEFVLSAGKDGRTQVATLGRDGYRTYSVRDACLVVDRLVEQDAEKMGRIERPLGPAGKNAGSGSGADTVMLPEGRLLAHFVLSYAPGDLPESPFRGIPVLSFVAQSLVWNGDDALPEGSVILLKYQPGGAQ